MNLTLSERERAAWRDGNTELADALAAQSDNTTQVDQLAVIPDLLPNEDFLQDCIYRLLNCIDDYGCTGITAATVKSIADELVCIERGVWRDSQRVVSALDSAGVDV